MKLLTSVLILLALGTNDMIRSASNLPANSLYQLPAKFEPSKKAWESADKKLKKMSVEEKVGQLVHVGVNARFANQDSAFFLDLKRHVVENKVGGIIFFGAPIYETTHLANRMQELAEIPLLMSIDAETGMGMRFGDAINFPWAMAVAATGDPEFARKVGVVTGREAKAIGIHHVFAPVLDVNNNADNPVINVRSFGEDPHDVARFGVAFIEGLQSQRVLATAKHFPGHGDTNVDSHRGLPVINYSRERLETIELIPFRKAVEAGVASVMIAHIGLPQIDATEMKPLKTSIRPSYTESEVVVENAVIPASLTPKVITDILRKDMNFQGLVVTDALDMSGLTMYVDQDEAAVLAVNAGADILLKPANAKSAIDGLLNAVKTGRVTEARLNDSARKILAWKHELGLLKQKITPLGEIDRIVSNTETGALTEEISARAITLVRNDADLVPLKKDAGVCLLGMSNGFEGEGIMGPLSRTLRDGGLKFNAVLLQDNSTPEQVSRARELVTGCNTVVAALYGRVRTGATNSGLLPEAGAAILRELLDNNRKVVGISFGNPYLLGAFPKMKTYVVAYGDMPSLQRSAAKAIIGTQDISGRLPITLPGLYPRGTGIQLKTTGVQASRLR